MLKLTKGLLYCKDYEEAKNPIIMILSFTKKYSTDFFFHWNKCTTNSTLNGWWKLWKHWIAQPAKGRKTQFHCKKKPIITIIIIFKLHISKVYFGLKHCTPKLLSLHNYIYKPRGKKRWYYKKKKSTKEECTFPIETNVRVPSIYISLCTIVGYLIRHLKYQISHHSTI